LTLPALDGDKRYHHERANDHPSNLPTHGDGLTAVKARLEARRNRGVILIVKKGYVWN